MPISTWGLITCQQNYVYQMPLSVGLYLLPILLVLFIAIATMFGQTWRAAKANPADSLRTE